MNTVRRIIAYFPFISILLIVAMFPFRYTEWQRIALYSLAVTYPMDYIVNCRWQTWRWNVRKGVFVAFCVFALLTPIWQLMDPLKTDLYQMTINDFAPFFFVGIAGFLGMTDTIKMEYVAWVMLVVSNIILGYLIMQTGIDFSDIGVWKEAFWINRTELINTHMVVNLYLNFTLILSTMILLETRYHWIIKSLTALMMLMPIGALLFTEGRTGMITFIAFVLILLLYYSIQNWHWWMLPIVVLFGIGAGIFLSHNERIQEGYGTTDPRIYLWTVCWEEIAERPVIGYGVCSARADFVRRVKENKYLKGYVHWIENDSKCNQNGVIKYDMMHPHNAILESWSRYGIVGLVVCLLCLLGPLGMRLGKHQLFLSLCALAFLIQAIFESLGSNLQPIFLTAMVLLFYSEYVAQTAPSVT